MNFTLSTFNCNANCCKKLLDGRILHVCKEVNDVNHICSGKYMTQTMRSSKDLDGKFYKIKVLSCGLLA